MIVLRYKETDEVLVLTLAQVLDMVNSDRSDSWEDYDESDWQEGVREWTHYEIISENASLCENATICENKYYDVSVTRTSSQTIDFVVMASSESEAMSNALDKAYNTVYNKEDSRSYEITRINPR